MAMEMKRRPARSRLVVLALTAGLVLGVGSVALVEYYDTSPTRAPAVPVAIDTLPYR